MAQRGPWRSVWTADSWRLILSCLLAGVLHGVVFLLVTMLSPVQITEDPVSSVLRVRISPSVSSDIGIPEPAPRTTDNSEVPLPAVIPPQEPPPVGDISRPGEEEPPIPPEEDSETILPEVSSLPAQDPVPGPVPGTAEADEPASAEAVRGSPPVRGEEPSAGSGVPAAEFAALSAGRNLPLPEYPAAARRFGYQGTVTVAITVASDGSIASAEILESSGFSLLDMEALKTVLQKWSFHPPEREVNIIKEFVFSLSG